MISDINEADIEHVLMMSDRFVGENFHTYESLRDYLFDKRKILKVYRIKDEIIGFVKGQIIEKNEFKKSLLKTNASIENELSGEGYLGFAETIGVKEEYRGTSVARELTNELIKSINKLEKVDIICTTVWKTSVGANARRLVERTGFKYITEIYKFWYHDSIEKGYSCPHCGQPPCSCSMIFYKL